jgi:CBS domain
MAVPLNINTCRGCKAGIVQKKKVIEILLPYREYVPLSPGLSTDEPITRAIQIMLEHDIRCMAVVRRHKPIGIVTLEDALQALGLQSGSGKEKKGVPRFNR